MAAGAAKSLEQFQGGLERREKLPDIHQVVGDAGQGVPVVPGQGRWGDLCVSLGEGRSSTGEVSLQAPGRGLGVEGQAR